MAKKLRLPNTFNGANLELFVYDKHYIKHILSIDDHWHECIDTVTSNWEKITYYRDVNDNMNKRLNKMYKKIVEYEYEKSISNKILDRFK